jgi:nucleotide-binding universal stress UspA family protein
MLIVIKVGARAAGDDSSLNICREVAMKSILVEVTGNDVQDGPLQAALDLVRATNGHLTCLQVAPYAAYAAGESFVDPGMLSALVESIDAQCLEEQARIESALANEGISWDWVRRDGDDVQAIASQSRLADAVVIAQRGHRNDAARQTGFVGALTLASRAPVIVVPPAIRGFAVAGSAMIAWDGSFECAQALRAALPMLAFAEAVDVITVGDTQHEFPATSACTHLSRHGIRAELLVRTCEGETTAATILRAAAERGAAYLVMGAYGHSRLREYVFGGVTRSLIAEATLPLVLAH